MKKIAAIGLILMCFCKFSIAAKNDDRKIIKGTVLNYAVKEGKVSYKLKITVAEWNTEGNIKLQWQTTGGKISKGVCTFPFRSLQFSTSLKTKLKEGNEILTETASRWFIDYDVYDDLHNSAIDSDITIDDDYITFLPDGDNTEHGILYNNVKTNFDAVNASGDNKGAIAKISVIEFTDNIILVDNLESGTFSIHLMTIQTPKSPEEKMAKQLMDAIAPKGKVPLKKMDAVKFAKVKNAYPLLATIENYDGTKGGTIIKPITETYEFRYANHAPNPPSLIDCLTADLKILNNQKEKYNVTDAEAISTKQLPSATAKKLLDVYTKFEYNSIPGYRPWTHWSFVRSLTETQREQLSKELEGYIATYGFSE